MNRIHPLAFFGGLKWLDGRPLTEVIERYRAKIFEQALFSFDDDGRPRFNLILTGRAKKNWKSADLILAALYRLLAWQSSAGNQCYCLSNDEDQAADNLELAKKLIQVNPVLSGAVDIKLKLIERRDGKGFMEILPAGDVVGSHGKTYLFVGYDEVHGYRNWDLMEAMQPDPSRPDAMQWITSYASIYHKPGVPLFDLMAAGKKGTDPQMLFCWYAADFCTDPAFESLDPESRANPSRGSWEDQGYLAQQQSRLPAHKYRRLHLNLPGLPEGSAFTAEMVMGAIERGVKVRPCMAGVKYFGFVDMSGGSSDDACLALAHKDQDGHAVLDCIMNQGQRPPFDPRKAVERFASVLKEYGCSSVTGDKYAGETFRLDFQREGIVYRLSGKTRHELYESLEPRLNGSKVVLLDHAEMESQFLSLIWRGGKIDHPNGAHDDYANAATGAVEAVMGKQVKSVDDYPMVISKGKSEVVPAAMDSEQQAFWREIVAGNRLDRIIQEAFEGKPIEWTGLDLQQKTALEDQLRDMVRELRVHGGHERAKFFKRQLDQARI